MRKIAVLAMVVSAALSFSVTVFAPRTDNFPERPIEGKLGKQTKIAFTSERNENFDIHVVNADGSELKRLTNNPAWDELPAWSPDGRKLAFQSIRNGNWDIYVMNADGTEQKRLTRDSAHDARPFWSSDGKRIVFTSKRSGKSQIHVMNADGTGQ